MHLAEEVVKGQEAKGKVVLRGPFLESHALTRKRCAFMGQHRNLGKPGSTTSVENGRGISSIPVDCSERSRSHFHEVGEFDVVP